MQKIIDPKEVPQMFRDGKLWHGIKLEFCSDYNQAWTGPLHLAGYSVKAPKKCFIALSDPFHVLWFEQARFPLPVLKIDDPVIVWMSKKVEHKRYFKNFNWDGDIVCFDSGATSWSTTSGTRWNGWRLPTVEELLDGGYPGDYYTSMGM